MLLIAVLCFVLSNAFNLFGQPNIDSNDISDQDLTIEKGEVDDLDVKGKVNEKRIIDEEKMDNPAKIIDEPEKQFRRDKSNIKESDNIDKKEENAFTNSKDIKPRKQVLNIDGLIEIKDGAFKYNRIPGISIYKEKHLNEYSDVVKTPVIKEPSGEENSKGLFGLEKDTVDILIKILLICLIIGVIIMFRFRSKSRDNSKVLRRFPGA